MITITNNKVAGFVPIWAEFRGFSFLFDNPGNSLSPLADVELINCRLGPDGELSLYSKLQDALAGIGGDLLTRAYLFCSLPVASYHVTVCDGINADNLASVREEYRNEIAAFLFGLPATFNALPASLRFLTASELATASVRRITFKFQKITIWSNKVMVALLQAADEESAQRLTDLEQARRELCYQFLSDLGIAISQDYSPHVSLGYFANLEHGELAQGRLAEWNEEFSNTIGATAISFQSVSLYGFTDMASFFRRLL